MPSLSRRFVNIITTLFTLLPVTRPLTSLPNELILLIAEYLDPQDLSPLIKVNRHLAFLLAPLFHKQGLQWARKFSSSFPAPVIYAARRGDETMVKLLLEVGAKIDEADHTGETALHIATACGDINVVTLLLKQGANVNPQNLAGVTPLDLAVRRVRTPVVKLLLGNGASIIQQNPDRDMHPALRWAAEFGTVEMVELILGSLSDAEVTAKDSKGRTALHFAVERTRKPVVVAQMLLERGVDINARDTGQCTALNYALAELMREYSFEKRIVAHRRQREAIVTLLVEKRAELDPTTVNMLVDCEKKVGRFSKIRGTLTQALDTLK